MTAKTAVRRTQMTGGATRRGTNAAASGGLREQRKDERRRALVEAARALLSEDVDGFSMPVLAARAGVSLVTPYNLFGSKAAILHAVFRAEISGLHRALDARRDDPLKSLLGSADMLAETFGRKPVFYRSLARSMAALGPEELSQLILPLGETILDPAVLALDEAGLLMPVVPAKVVANQVSRAVDAVIAKWVPADLSADHLAAEMRLAIAMILLGVIVDEKRPLLIETIQAAMRDGETHGEEPA